MRHSPIDTPAHTKWMRFIAKEHSSVGLLDAMAATAAAAAASAALEGVRSLRAAYLVLFFANAIFAALFKAVGQGSHRHQLPLPHLFSRAVCHASFDFGSLSIAVLHF